MSAMLRTQESQKIIWKILPKPYNLVDKKTEEQKRIDARLNMAWIARQR